MSEKGVFTFGSGLQQTLVTLPNETLCHYITDDELERLSDMRKEPVMEIFLVTIGAFVGSIVPAVQEYSKFTNDPKTLSVVGLITMGLAVAMLAVSIVTGILWRQRGKTHGSMVNTIRSRPKAPVQSA